MSKNKFKDLSGETFGKLTVIGRAGYFSNKAIRWECNCECGAVIFAYGWSLTNGNKVSCGCASTSPISKGMYNRKHNTYTSPYPPELISSITKRLVFYQSVGIQVRSKRLHWDEWCSNVVLPEKFR